MESTFNCYWLADGLMDAEYKVYLVNTSAVKQYEGLKPADDKHDTFWFAHLPRLGILSAGYIYPKERRPIRDLVQIAKRQATVKRKVKVTANAAINT
jgi:hypothetical protein